MAPPIIRRETSYHGRYNIITILCFLYSSTCSVRLFCAFVRKGFFNILKSFTTHTALMVLLIVDGRAAVPIAAAPTRNTGASGGVSIVNGKADAAHVFLFIALRFT